MENQDVSVQAQGLFDAFRLFDKELIDKVMAIAETIHVQKLPEGITRISIDLKPRQD